MTKSIVGVYDRLDTARSVVSDLVDAGFDRSQINIVAHDPDESYAGYIDNNTGDDVAAGAGIGATIGGIGGLLVGLGALAIPGVGPVIAAGPIMAALTGAGIGAVTGGLIGALVDLGIPEEEASLYSEGLRRGNILVIAQVNDHRVDEASRIMQRRGLLDIHEQAETWRSEGWEGVPATASTARNVDTRRNDRMDTGSRRSTEGSEVRTGATRSGDQEETFEVVQEEVKIGKRAVEGGGVRVHSYVREVPVEEDVRLREEHVNVERRPVNRPARAGELESFKEGSIEMTERSEEAVISKDARVVEEVVVSKDVNERTEKVRDTVRRTEVDVERVGNGNARNDFNMYDKEFRTHFQNTYGSRGVTYDRFQPAYRYGYDLGGDQRFRGRNWNEIERDVRRDWESRNQGPWEDFKDAVRHGWNKVTGKA